MKKTKIFLFLSLTLMLGCTNSEINYNQQNLEVPIATQIKENVSEKNSVTKETEKSKLEIKTEEIKIENLNSLDILLKKLPVIPKKNVVKEIPYLVYTNHLVGDFSQEKIESEDEIIKFYKNTSIVAYGSKASFFRWGFKRNTEELKKLLNKNLYSLSKNRNKNILTLSKNEWIKVSLKENPIGTIKSMHVVERGKSGMALALLIEGEKGTYIIYNEHNIRKILGGGNYIITNSVTGKKLLKNSTLIPSGFVAFEKIGNSYYFYGGGYGHGVGMVQSGVRSLVKIYGKNFKEVLNFYYPGTNLEKYKDRNIRVAITNNGRELDHSSVIFISSGKSKIKFNGKTYNILKNKPFKIENKNGNIIITKNKKLLASGKGTVSLRSESTIGILSIQMKNLKIKTPYYKGVFEVKISKNSEKLRVINEVGLESYLKKVVPGEMSPSFGVEALKVQAIAARTYALRDIERYRYKKNGYHIDDTSSSQVYNRSDENKLSNEAIKATTGLVLKYQDKIVDAKYYSTSSGFGEAANYVW
ncbi:MAG: SpoIID/LytB domain-containing protein [Fusobacteriaceae bacterium]